VAIKDGGSAVRNGDVFTTNQAATLISSNLYSSKAVVAFDGLQLSIDGTGATAPAAGDIFRVLSKQQYNGDTNDSAIEIGNNVTTSTLLNGDSVFVGSRGGTDVFGALQSLTRALLANNVDAIQSAHASVTSATNQVLQSQGTIGARTNRLQGIQDGLGQSKADIETLLSGIEDIDFAKAASDLTIQQLALQAAAQSASRVLQSSLLDFLK
jgi:flagellin-like hook-associated protein FlgL